MQHQATPTRISIKNILFATDFSQCSLAALRCVEPLAEHFGSRTYLTHVIPSEQQRLEFAPFPDIEPDQVERDANRQIGTLLRTDIVRRLRCEVLLLEGGICSALTKAAKEYEIDLLVLGASGADHPFGTILGSVAEEILRKAPCPVLTVARGKSIPEYGAARRILCATDFTERSDAVMEYALTLAEACGAQLIFLQATEQRPPLAAKRFPELWSGSEDALLRFLPMLSNVSPEPECRLQFGPWVTVLLHMAEQWHPDLIMMDFHLGSDVFRLPGMVAHEVVRRAPCAVLTVRNGARLSEGG